MATGAFACMNRLRLADFEPEFTRWGMVTDTVDEEANRGASRLEFPIPASEVVVLDAFHHHHWRVRWDSLVSATDLLGGALCPFVGGKPRDDAGGERQRLGVFGVRVLNVGKIGENQLQDWLQCTAQDADRVRRSLSLLL